jgi:hypothetical protein
MSNHFRERADELVDRFTEQTGVTLSDNDTRTLARMIAAALAGEVQSVADKLDTLTGELRSDIAKPELGL